MAFLITTTGEQNPVIFEELGARSFEHPTNDYDLLLEYTLDELSASSTLQIAIDKGHITVKDEYGNPITKPQPVFGSGYHFSYNDKEISTTTTRYEKVHTLEFGIIAGGKYRVGCSYQYRYYGEKGIGFQTRMLFDGEHTIFENGTSNFYLADENDYIPISTFNYIDLEKGEHFLALEVCLRLPKNVEKKGAVGYIKDMKLEVWRVI